MDVRPVSFRIDHSPPRPGEPAWRALLLALLLVLAAQGQLTHALEHQLHPADGPCFVCLAASHLGNGLTGAARLSPPPPDPKPIPPSALGAARQIAAAGFKPRAPPVSG